MGYFHKIATADRFVILDDVQYTKNSLINRNKIKTPQGEQWLTIPVSFRFGESIKEVKVDSTVDWRSRHLKTIEACYRKASHFKEIYKGLQEIYYWCEWRTLCELNIALIERVSSCLQITTKMLKSSDLNVEGISTVRLINLVKSLKGDAYLSGSGGMKYQDEELFAQANIRLIYSDFSHPLYPQRWGQFRPNLSIIDFLFNMGMSAITNKKG